MDVALDQRSPLGAAPADPGRGHSSAPSGGSSGVPTPRRAPWRGVYVHLHPVGGQNETGPGALYRSVWDLVSSNQQCREWALATLQKKTPRVRVVKRNSSAG